MLSDARKEFAEKIKKRFGKVSQHLYGEDILLDIEIDKLLSEYKD